MPPKVSPEVTKRAMGLCFSSFMGITGLVPSHQGPCFALHTRHGVAGVHSLFQILAGLLGVTPSHSLYRLHNYPCLVATLNFDCPLQPWDATWDVEPVRCCCRVSISQPQPFLEVDCKFLRVSLKGTTWWEVVLKCY